MVMTVRRDTWAVVAVMALAASARPGEQPASGQQFERDVLSLLSARCVNCHGATKPKARLDLRSRSAMLSGGESGPALVPGSAEKSLLFQMITKGEMPPKGKTPLTAAETARLKAWIDAGAPAVQSAAGQESPKITDKDRQFWAFRKPVRPEVPRVRAADRVRTPIDAFVLASLETKGLSLSPDADPTTLVRRVYFDLVGLPPSPEEADAFLADRWPDAYERLVDRLLESPHYGERWGRHWLDAAGYSDSIGGDNDPGQCFPREGIWRYRDYVVRALNNDKPFDRFLTEQLAGDEIDDWRSAAVFTPEIREHLVATGLLRTTVDHTFEDELNRPFERYQVLHDSIENLTTNLLGLTVACARCHDHKFDPISQVEYYRLLAALKPVYNPEAWIKPQDRHLDDVSAKEKVVMDRHNAEIDRQIAEWEGQVDALTQPYQKKLYDRRLSALPEAIRGDTAAALATPADKRNAVQRYLAEKLGPSLQVPPKEVSRAVSDSDRAKYNELKGRITSLKGRKHASGKIQAAWEPGAAPPAFIFRRGNLMTPGAEVRPGFFAVLCEPDTSTVISAPAAAAKSSGRRTALARWLTRPDHPLTARVFVNRVWQHYFGEGIVATSDNFGHLGARPTHPELLDFLATQFVQSGWKVKALHRLIVTSSVYRQASTSRPESELVDPGNQLLWRQRLRRLESEAVRDAVLTVSGRLDRTMGGPPVPIEPRPDGMVVVPKQGLPTPTAACRRCLYLFARRNYNLTLLNVFDQPVMATNCTRRIQSAVPLQSLTLLNDAMLLEHAEHFAARVAAVASTPGMQIEAAFRIAFGRRPTLKEMASSTAFLNKLRDRYAAKVPATVAQRQALAGLCQMLMCANEFLYIG
jgi:cytochrome c553